jgi:hypothetical protein
VRIRAASSASAHDYAERRWEHGASVAEEEDVAWHDVVELRAVIRDPVPVSSSPFARSSRWVTSPRCRPPSNRKRRSR